MAAISNDWLEPLKPEFAKPYYRKLYATVVQEYHTHQIFPPANDLFHAFEATPLHRRMDSASPSAPKWRFRLHW